MESLGAARSLSLLLIALLGVLGQIGVAPLGLPPLPADSLSHGWERFYSPVREVGFLAVFLSAIAVSLLQYKAETTPGTLVLTPLAVAMYLALPSLSRMLPEDLGAGILALFLFVTLIAIILSVLADIRPEEPGRPAYYTALGFIIALVMYLGSLGFAVSIPDTLLGDELPKVRWGTELLAVLVVPAFLIFTPMAKTLWNRPPRGFWFSDRMEEDGR